MFDDNIRLKVLGKKADAQVSEVEANSPSFDQRSTGGNIRPLGEHEFVLISTIHFHEICKNKFHRK